MQQTQQEFITNNLNHFGYSSIKELIEKLYLEGIVESYRRIEKQIAIENDIRDRFVADFYEKNSLLKEWLQFKILHINWERWVFKNESDLGRADLSFELSGFDFIVECKRLKFADKKYIDDGLNRFIELEYAKNDDFAGMIGFVVSGNENTISDNLKKKVNAIDSLVSDFSKECVSWNPAFNSSHKRKDNSVIYIYHLFFNFSQKIIL